MKQTKRDTVESKCAACGGTGFAAVKQPAQPGRRIYPPRCAKCHGSGRIRKAAG
jgi:DnaJ-class molecular chaperone